MADRTIRALITGDSSGAVKAFSEAAGAAEVGSTAMADAADAGTSRIGGAFGKLGGIAQSAGLPFSDSISKMGDKFNEAETKGQSFGAAMSTLGGAALLGVGAAAAGVAIESVNLANKFQSTTTTIAANANISTAAAKGIGDAFLNTAGTTIFSGQEMATAYAAVAGQLGQTQGKALTSAQAVGVMKAAMDLAEGSGTSLTASTTDLSNVMQSFGIKASGAADASNVLFNASRLTGSTVDGVTQSFTKLHSTLGAVSPSIGDLGGLLVDLTDHGETGRKALSAVNTALNGMLAPSKAVKAAQDEMGVSVFTASGQFVGMDSLLGQLQPKLAGMSQEQQLAALKAIGLGTANKALLTTILDGPAAFDKATAAVTRTGAAHDAADKQSQTLSHQMETLKATAEDLGTKFGEVLIPKLEALGKDIASVITWFEKHKAVAEVLAITVGGILLAAIAAYIISMAAAAIATIAAALPILAIIVAIGLLVAAGLYLSSHWQQVWTDIKNWFNDALSFLRSGFGTLGILLLGPIAPLLLLALHWQQVWNDAKSVVTTVWDAIKGVVMPAVTVITTIVKVGVDLISTEWKVAWDIVSASVKIVWDAISALIKVAIDVITGIIKVFLDLVTGNWGAAWNAIKATADQVWNAIKDLAIQIWNDIKGMFTAVINNIKDAFVTGWNDIKGFLSDAWNAIKDAATTVWDAVVSFITGIPGKILSGLSSLGSDLLNLATTAWDSFSTAVHDVVVNDVLPFITGLPGKILDALGDLGSMLLDAGKQIIQGLINGIENMAQQAVNAVKKVGSDIMGAVKSGFGIFSPSTVFHGFGENMMQGLANGINANAPAAIGAISKTVQALSQPISASVLMSGSATTPAGLPSIAGAGFAGAGTAAASGGTPIIYSPTQTFTFQGTGPEMQAQFKQAMDEHDQQLIATLTAGRSRSQF